MGEEVVITQTVFALIDTGSIAVFFEHNYDAYVVEI